MRRIGATRPGKIDPQWTQPLYQRFVTRWAGDYLTYRSLARSGLKLVEPDMADNHDDEAAADAWAKAHDSNYRKAA